MGKGGEPKDPDRVPLDISYTTDHLARDVGNLILDFWAQKRKVAALEGRVDELEKVNASVHDE